MTGLLIKLFIPRAEQTGDPAVRRGYGRLGGGVGIAANLLLFAIKLAVGLLTASIAVVADAFNNLTDAGSSLVTLAGFHLAGQEADEEHPFGHGRMEYLSGLIVSLVILLVGVELGKSSVGRILSPGDVTLSTTSGLLLGGAVLIKLWMWGFYRRLGRAIDSPTLRAAATDSLSDCAATGLVLVSALLGSRLGVRVDGWAGLVVAALILKAGWDSAREMLDPLLGRPMDPELAEDIDRLVLDHPYILGIHDLIYHDYGPGRAMMSFHAEVPADGDLLAIHDVIDHIERELKQRNGIETVIHMDPVVQDEQTEQLRARVEELAKQIDPRLSIHDFRTTAGPIHTNLIFDVVVPYGFGLTDAQVRQELVGQVRSLSQRYYAVVQVDRPYVENRG